jgi:hypothetical protein
VESPFSVRLFAAVFSPEKQFAGVTSMNAKISHPRTHFSNAMSFVPHDNTDL